MAARLTDKQKQKIIADYLETNSYRAAAKINGVADGTVKRIVLECGEIEQKIAEKKEQNTADILSYMESKRNAVCEIIGTGLEVLPEKIRSAKTASDVTTALGTLIDKWAIITGGPKDDTTEDELSRSMRELGEGLESDD